MTVDDASQFGGDDDFGFNWLAFAVVLLASIPLYAAWRVVGPDQGILDFVGDVVIPAILIILYHLDVRAAGSSRPSAALSSGTPVQVCDAPPPARPERRDGPASFVVVFGSGHTLSQLAPSNRPLDRPAGLCES